MIKQGQITKAKKPRKRAPRKGEGRPSKFDGINQDKVKLLALKGFTDKEMAEFFDVDERTWNRWKQAHEEFCQSLKDWKLEADTKVERSLYERACGYSHDAIHISNYQGIIEETPIIKHYPPSEVACIFWLKNRQPGKWRDKQEIEHSGEGFTLSIEPREKET